MTSRIASVETSVVRYPVAGDFKFFIRNAGQPVTRDTVVVKITDYEGRVGWGQCVPSPTWSYETIETVKTTLDLHLAPAIRGMDAFDVDLLWQTMNRVIAGSFSTGQPIAKSGIDLALFDLTGRCLEQSPRQRWKKAGRRNAVTLSWTLDVRTPAKVAAAVTAAFARGYQHFNVKIGHDAGEDLAVCRELRRLAPTAFVWADANGGYDEPTALTVAPKLAELGFAALEQPVPANRLAWFRSLRKQRALPILMDEAVVSLSDLETFHALDLLDGVAMKVSRSGGLTEARRLIEYLQQHGLHVFASGLTDPDIALAACLHLFSAYDLPNPAALNGPQFLTGSILQKPLAFEDDQALVPQGSGLAVDVARLDPL